MPLLLIILIWIGIAGLALATWLWLREQSRRGVVEAIGGREHGKLLPSGRRFGSTGRTRGGLGRNGWNRCVGKD